MRISVISDTHTRHNLVTKDLPGGDLLLHTGDLMNSGYVEKDIIEFCNWYSSIDNYESKVFIAGNHDRMFQDFPEKIQEILEFHKSIDYVQDDTLVLYGDGPEGNSPEDNIRIYGSPWQPEFCNWAFNLPKNGMGLASKWEAVPKNTDILLTHGPAWGILDTVAGRQFDNLGCELLAERIQQIQPKIHVCGHIHTGYGYRFYNNTHFFNASVLDEQYEYTQKPITFDWDKATNTVEFL
jgi:hypothetical protein